jgi:hypothetical protein
MYATVVTATAKTRLVKQGRQSPTGSHVVIPTTERLMTAPGTQEAGNSVGFEVLTAVVIETYIF